MNKDQLGDYPEHQFGGLLCHDCASLEATKLSIVLQFHANEWDPLMTDTQLSAWQDILERLAKAGGADRTEHGSTTIF